MKNKITIIHIIPSDSGGGAERIVQYMLNNSNSSFNHEAIFFTEPFRFHDKGVYFNLSPRSISNIFKLRKILKFKRKQGYEVIVHAHLTWPLFFSAIANIGINFKMVYTEHSSNNKRRKSLFYLLDLLAYSRYSKIVGISEGVTKSLLNWLGVKFDKKICTINNGAELFFNIPRSNKLAHSKLNLLSVGSLKTLKGFDTAIKSLRTIKPLVGCYTIVGKGPYLDSLKKTALEYGVSDIVNFVGWTDSTERFYYDSDILLIPSHWEGFGLVAVEGMSTGLPVIASNVAGLNDVILAHSISSILIDDFKEPNEWSFAISQLHERLQAEAREISITSRARSEEFKIEFMIGNYESLYKELCSQ